MEVVVQIVSIVGALLALLAYLLISHGKLTGQDINYHLLNIIASLCLGISSVIIFNVGHILLNIAWTTIAAITIIRLLKRKTSQTGD